jgi:hypothetical protein
MRKMRDIDILQACPNISPRVAYKVHRMDR